MHDTRSIVVVGAGLAGLSAALHLARSGRRVILLEQSEIAGGRGASHQDGDWIFNLGPHALYRAGVGLQILQDLGVRIQGKTPPVLGIQGIAGERTLSLARSWLSPVEALRLALFLTRLLSLKPHEWRGQSTAEWLAGDRLLAGARLQQLLGMLVRVSTYVADHQRLSAELAIQQLQLALKANVIYLDGGWQSLIDQLIQQARRQGVEIRFGCGLKAMSRLTEHWHLQLGAGESFDADAVILAMSPQAVQRLLAHWPELELHRQLQALEPVRAACLDLGLSALPVPSHLAAFGLDEASYLSVHSASARLAAPGAALIHALWYLGEADSLDPSAQRARLEKRLDLFQPGWRELAGPAHFYPHLTVTHALATPGRGLAGRPAAAVAGLPELYLAGDWVGDIGWLADAALASGRQ
ncbi:MAG: phytoene desaturase family protein, partial [Candidatus Sericytochromatia bacterium]